MYCLLQIAHTTTSHVYVLDCYSGPSRAGGCGGVRHPPNNFLVSITTHKIHFTHAFPFLHNNFVLPLCFQYFPTLFYYVVPPTWPPWHQMQTINTNHHLIFDNPGAYIFFAWLLLKHFDKLQLCAVQNTKEKE